MRSTLLLARRYLAHHPLRSSVLVVGVALTLLLPMAVQLLAFRYGASLTARAEGTPLVLGAQGSRYDLVLQTLYFRGRTPRPISMAAVQRLRDERLPGELAPLAAAIPLYTEGSAKGHPLVGTTHDYYGFRGLVCASGELPLWVGDCVLGAAAAAELGVGPGDRLVTDRERSYDLAAGYPLAMNVVGVLAPSGSPDDGAVFCDLKTTWVAAGLAHGHGEADQQGEEQVLRRERDGRIVLNASLLEYTEITPANRDTFHVHGGPQEQPLTGVIAVPSDDRARTVLKARYRLREGELLLVPTEVMGELLGLVFRAKRFFDANAALVAGATGLFLAVIVALTLAVRARERRTLFRIGCARATVTRLMATELLLLVGAGAALAAGGALLLVQLVGRSTGSL